MLIACVQSDVSFAAPESNLQRVLGWMERASELENPADLVVFPECMLTGYNFDCRAAAVRASLSIESPILKAIADAAARWGQFVTLGFLESAEGRLESASRPHDSEDRSLYNSAALIGPQGVIGCYRKIHLPHLGVDRFVDQGNFHYQVHTASSESETYSSETAPSGAAAQIGMAICYDASFPEPMRVLGLAGADIIALGTNWPIEANRTPEIVPPARSMENHLFFVAANRVGTENGVHFCGRSSICGPDGVILAKSDDDRETMLTASVDLGLARNKEIRRSEDSHVIHRFDDRRPEFYLPIVE